MPNTGRMKKHVTEFYAEMKQQVPCKLIQTGKNPENLLVYLHGYKQNIQILEKKFEKITTINAYHLFVQAPHVLYEQSRKRPLEEWGRAWYFYDGSQQVFIDSMEESSKFLESLLKSVKNQYSVSRTGIIGYSMGGYLAGYFAFSRSVLIDDLAVIGARLKTEVFEQTLSQYKHIKVLALHGKNDESVMLKPQRDEIEKLKQLGYQAELLQTNSGHRIDPEIVDNLHKWLITNGF